MNRLPCLAQRRPRVLSSAATLACALCLAAGAARAERAALLPVEAATLLPTARKDVDAALRVAAAQLGLDVQPDTVTANHVDEAYRAGLRCSFLDPVCARRVGLVADVDIIIVAAADEVARERFVLRLSLVPVSEKPAKLVAGEISLPTADNGHSVRAVMERLLKDQGAPTALPVKIQIDPADGIVVVDGKPVTPGIVWLMPGQHLVAMSAPDHAPLERSIVVNATGLDNELSVALQPVQVNVDVNVALIGGVALASVGAGVGVVGTLVGVTVNNELNPRNGPIDFDERQSLQTQGQVAVGVAILGGVAMAAGIALATIGALD